jgi:O-antigen ligase
MILNKNLLIIIKVLFFLFPFFLISGPFLPDLFISLLSIIALIFFLKGTIISNYQKYIFIFLVSFYIYINFNSIISDFSVISFRISIPYIRYIIFAFFFAYLLKSLNSLQKIIIASFLISYLFLFFDSIYQIIFGYNITGNPLLENRSNSFFGSKLVMGSYVARTLPIIIGISFLVKYKNLKFVRFLIFLICGSLVFFSGERLSLIYYLITLLIYCFIDYDKKYFFKIFLIIFLFLTVLFFVKPKTGERLLFHTLSQFKDNGVYSVFSFRHQLHLMTAYNMYKDQKLFGHGLKSFRNLCNKEKYVPIEKILKDNKIFSPIEGYLFIRHNLLLITKNNILPKKIEDSSQNSILNNLSEFKEEIYVIHLKGNTQFFYKKDGDYIKKDEAIISLYEFKNGCNTHPHNIHLEFLSELGSIGYLFLLLAMLFVFYNFVLIILNRKKFNKISNNNIFFLFILLGLANNLFPFFPSGSFFNNWLSIIFYFNLGFLIYFYRKV